VCEREREREKARARGLLMRDMEGNREERERVEGGGKEGRRGGGRESTREQASERV
jgi:hypothetical protein